MKIAIAAILLLAIPACASRSYLAPGIQFQERRPLIDAYWGAEYERAPFTNEELTDLFKKSFETSFKSGEKSEFITSTLILALVTNGDANFSKVLSEQPFNIQADVLKRVSSLWRHYHLKYPRTQALARKAEQGAAANP